jgi:hypothetical protein
MQKQCAFQGYNKLAGVHAPTIQYVRKITSGKGLGGTESDVLQAITFGMNYEHNSDCIDFLNTCRVDTLLHFTKTMLGVIQQNIDNSPMSSEVPKSILADKYADVIRILAKNALVTSNELDFITTKCGPRIAALPDTLLLPVGVCHGDLTLSNVLLQRPTNNIILIDFLDSFIESPLADVCKLRQDTRFGWSLFLSGGPQGYDPVRMAATLRYLDSALVRYCSQFEWWVQYHTIVELLNQLRVLQYAKERRIVDHLLSTIRTILDS